MSAMSVEVPYPVFQDRDGEPLENGYVWVGVANQNPQTNPVQVYFDRDLTQPAAQPMRTIAGYISNAGTPAQIYIDGNSYSIIVQDKNGTMVYNFPNGTGIEPIPNDACGLSYKPNFSGAVTRPTCEKLEESVSVKDFGAIGDGVTDDTTAIANALAYAGISKSAVYFPGTPNSYRITNEFIVPDGVTLYGDGWSSKIVQTVREKNVFISGSYCTFDKLHLIGDNGTTAISFTKNNGIFASDKNVINIQNCYFEKFESGGVQLRNCKDTNISNNWFFSNPWGTIASASDITLYSPSTGARVVITNNFCLSNNSQAMFLDALGGDGDIVVSNNICVTLDPATCIESGTWALIANGGRRRHGIVVGYTSSSVSGPRTIVDGNICRNTRWTGIYKQGQSSGAVIISNNLCDLNGYQSANSLSAGIFINDSGNEQVVGNYITNFQNPQQGVGGITSVGGNDAPVLISNNVVKGSLGNGLFSTINSQNLKISENLFISNARQDIFHIPNPGTSQGNHIISNNYIYKTSIERAIIIDIQSGLLPVYIENNRILGSDNTVASTSNAGIFLRGTSVFSMCTVKNNIVENMYYGVYVNNYLTTNRDAVIESNIIKNCNTGFGLGANSANQTIPLVNNIFINTSNPVTSVLSGFGVGRIVTRSGTKFVIQTTSAAPTTGAWERGDKAYFNDATAGGKIGAVCVTSGSPGTWKNFGAIDA
jgi:hypothetical protein